MEIVINNTFFPYDLGCKVLKAKYKDGCPPDMDLEHIWDEIQPIEFSEIFTIKNLESRRVALQYMGFEEFIKSLNPELISEITLDKSSSWEVDGSEYLHMYKDTYKLYKVKGEKLSEGVESYMRVPIADCHFVQFKDTSTSREYMIWVDVKHIMDNKVDVYNSIDAIDAIAWTIQTNIPTGFIKTIIRQGDCILFQPTGTYVPLDKPRHLLRDEYVKLMMSES